MKTPTEKQINEFKYKTRPYKTLGDLIKFNRIERHPCKKNKTSSIHTRRNPDKLGYSKLRMGHTTKRFAFKEIYGV